MPQLILVRHGNTFEKDQTPTRVGARTDMKLTAKGEEQGLAVAKTIADKYAPVSGIVTGPLVRTRRFAEMIGEATNNVFTIDERLTEVDYGLWENMTDEAIRAKYGPEALDAWEKDGKWPEGMNWAPSLEKLEHNIKAFLEEQHKKLLTPGSMNRVAVTSNGIMRFVYRALTGNPPGPDAKVKTGAYCVLTPTETGWSIAAWNVKPE